MKTKGAKKLTREQFLRRVLDGRLQADQALVCLTGQLHAFEKKYNLRSEVFYRLIVGTPAEDQPDFLKWAICYRSYFHAMQFHLCAEATAQDPAWIDA